MLKDNSVIGKLRQELYVLFWSQCSGFILSLFTSKFFGPENSLLYLCKAWRFLEIYVPNAYTVLCIIVKILKSLNLQISLYNSLYSMKWKSTFVNFRFTSLTLLNLTCLKLSQSSMSKQTIVNVSELWVSESPQLQNEKKVDNYWDGWDALFEKLVK